MSPRIGVLALQGAFAEHLAALSRLGARASPVRLPAELDAVDGLVIPGGESTAIGKLMRPYGFLEALRKRAREGFPIYGTCAGMILLAREIRDGEAVGEDRIGVMDIAVRRNAFGRQRESFEEELALPVLGDAPFPGVFIRAPLIERVGPEVSILCRLADGTIVAAEERNLLVSSFHPELTRDGRFHRYFLDMVAQSRVHAPSMGAPAAEP